MRNAFTLAETLITLGIIGVVAAITIPSTITKHRQNVIENGLKKAYSTITNAIIFSEIDNGPMSDWQEQNMDAYEFWDVYLKPYFKDAYICDKLKNCHGYKNVNYLKWHGMGEWNIATDNTRITFQLPDGTVVFWMKYSSEPEMKNFSKFIIVDANGSKGPNKGGVDVFRFERDYINGKITTLKGDCKTNIQYCTYEIMSNGWKFPDNYPIK